MSRLGDALAATRIVDLGRELTVGVPRVPNHVPYMHALQKMHPDQSDAYGMSAANDVVTMGTHVGTHVDGIAHIAVNDRLYGGHASADVQDHRDGFGAGLGIEGMEPRVCPAVLVDVPRLLGVDALPLDHEITVDECRRSLERDRAALPEGGAVLFRTGWGKAWPAEAYPVPASPGPGLAAVQWALEAGVTLFGSDTIVFEHTPADGLPVHRLLIVEQGIHIIEAMDLEQLSGTGYANLRLVLAPLKLRGATGSPVRPFALLEPRDD